MAAPILKEIPGGVCAPCGFLAAGVRGGLKRRGKDLALIFSLAPAAAAGLFTSNKVAAAPVLLSRDRVGQSSARAILVNAGNANACTGRQGFRDAVETARLAAEALAVAPEAVLVASTGIIGKPLPVARFQQGISRLAAALAPGGNTDAAEAILTTDTRPKEIAVELVHNGVPVRLGAACDDQRGLPHETLACRGPCELRPRVGVARGYETPLLSVSRGGGEPRGLDQLPDLLLFHGLGRIGAHAPPERDRLDNGHPRHLLKRNSIISCPFSTKRPDPPAALSP